MIIEGWLLTNDISFPGATAKVKIPSMKTSKQKHFKTNSAIFQLQFSFQLAVDICENPNL